MSLVKMGSCHCRAVQFSIRLDEEIKQAYRCNCSICTKKSIVVINIPIQDLQIIKGADNLTCYRWNTGVAKHYFCKTCGVHTHNHRRSVPNETGINLACLENQDLLAVMSIGVLNGAENSLVEE